jgi:hypothetical protein
VVDRALPIILAAMQPRCIFYLVVVDDNKPEELLAWFSDRGVDSKMVGRRKARNEWLSILRFERLKIDT